MFKKVLIAEDHEVRNLGVVNALTELKIDHFDFVSYCDEALQRIKMADTENQSYDLLITDLSFEQDHFHQNLKSGQELIREIRNIHPQIKIIVFSIENKPKIIDDLFKILSVDGFVSKGRNDGKELRNTIKKVFRGETVIPQEILNSIRNTPLKITENDELLLALLAKGFTQGEIEDHFKQNKFTPNSKSYIEKRLNELREIFNAKNNIELIVICKDLGII